MVARMSIAFNWVHKHEKCSLYTTYTMQSPDKMFDLTCFTFNTGQHNTLPVIADTKCHFYSHIPFLLKTKRNNSHIP